MATLGLCIITKELTSELGDLLTDLGSHFDRVYLQLNGGGTGGFTIGGVNLETSTFEWNDNFADARNTLLAEVKTDYWLWLDTDDVLEGAENLRAAVAEMERDGIDRLYALYEYFKNDLGEEIAPHWRERIMRTSHPYKWLGAVHETLITERRETSAKTEAFKVVHHKDQKDYEASVLRNHKILEAEYAKEPRDPRVTMYLGMSYFTQRQWSRAIELLLEHIRTSGSLEDQYRSWLRLAECHSKLGELHKSISACLEALKLLPNFPDAYFGLGQFYYELEDYPRCLEWLKLGMSQPDPETLAIVDPTLRYRSVMLGALAELQRGRVAPAWELFSYVSRQSPDYALVVKYQAMFEAAYSEHQAIQHAKWLVAYTATKHGKPGKVLEALPGSLPLDVRLSQERNKVYPPKLWLRKMRDGIWALKGSIVFFCGQTGEAWGPDMLDKGIGGSEEAVIYLSRELAKEGWQVVVYCERDEAYTDNKDDQADYYDNQDDRAVPPEYLPWHTFNPRDTFDVFVAWRAPESADGINARLVLCDLHDTIESQRVEQAVDYVHTFIVKSKYHRSLYAKVPDKKFRIVSNGFVKEQFNV